MATKPKADEKKDGFIANIDTANEEIQRLTGELATAVEANGVAVQAQKDAQAKFEKDLKAANDKAAADLQAATEKAEKDLKAATDKAEKDLKAATDKAMADGEAKGKTDVVKACAAAGVAVPAKIAGDVKVDDSTVKAPSNATGLQRAINANIEAQKKS